MGSFIKNISTKFKNRYRLIIRQDENLEEKVSIVLTPWNLLIVLSVGLFLFGAIIYILLAYTPLNYIFPTKSAKYSSIEQYEMIQKIDSLDDAMKQIRLQSEMLGKVLAGEDINVFLTENSTDVIIESPAVPEISNGRPNVALKHVRVNPANYNFFVPLKGVVSDTFNVDRKHRAMDIVAPSKSVIKSIQKGTVIFSSWTTRGGQTLIIQHPNDFLSVYKHNAALLKKVGTFVQAGDAVALVGNTGELTSGPHLHFELWKSGVAVDPMSYINF
ncbi:MAG: M23 family metallopeptidase [Bacteroidia bacterium]|nr:M23 family metallopeptidase [Bacteroidia bacterium]